MGRPWISPPLLLVKLSSANTHTDCDFLLRAGKRSIASYRTRGGSRIARPTTATSRANTTIDTVSIVFPRMPQ